MPLQQINRTNASTERQSCVSHCPRWEFSTECSSFRPFHGWTAAFQQKGLTILRTSQRLCALSAIAPAPGLQLGGGGAGYEQAGRWSPLPRQPDPPCPAASQTGSGRFTPPYCKPVRSNYSPALGMDKAAPQITNLIYRLWPATLLEAARPSSRREAEP